MFTIAIIISIIGNVYANREFNVGFGEIIVISSIILCAINCGLRVPRRFYSEDAGLFLFFYIQS